MSEVELDRPRLAHVLSGFPESLVSPPVLSLLGRFYLDLDALGRIDEESGEPLVDEVTLIALLREFVNASLAERLVRQLKALQGFALRSGPEQSRLPPREVSWFELARKIVIFDTEPAASFNDLRLAPGASSTQVVRSVQDRFPSLEDELLDSNILVPQIVKRLEDPDEAERVLKFVARQLGWWAALVTVLLLPAAIAASRKVPEFGTSDVAWPLSMNVLAAAVGGWTLTAVGCGLLAPLK